MLYGYAHAIGVGAMTTINVALASLVVAVVLGFVAAMCKSAPNRVLNAAASLYTSLSRSAPDFVWLLFLYYGGQAALNYAVSKISPGRSIDIDSYTASVIILGVVYGGYVAETFRGAILTVPTGQLEAGYAFGLRKRTVLFRILYPQMMRFAIPGLSNNWLALVKASAITSMVSLNELVFLSTAAGRATHHILMFFCIAGAIYLALTTVSLWVLRRLEMKFSIGVREVML
ncbi:MULTISPECIES: ABC transporter permease [unclassified Burkholderia]|uniref:ABC transporter permease n=1 Tax=unclassified Burkholderia TaxID=2613784 RepID=UPI000F56D190|nr:MULTISPECIES: ABC transporter permease subunit [unclassified Burkholderia]RQR69815.1 ABC transporter permease subunit [Burkholderia sp. Bp9012]RQR73308.1 ABC transporter permease subunit [Burkholderia sp. Bp9011]RQR85167.1 ABC transporter permease subunit [Burkholderia sp. Bp9010]RQZ40291.1 ABC transporter permease subunit [Burkholderia sp. Bp9099]